MPVLTLPGGHSLRRLFQHTVVRNALLLYVMQLSGYVLPLIALPYLSRVLSTERFGLVAYAQAFMFYFIILSDYGFNLTATRAVALAREDREKVSRLFSAVMAARMLLTLLGGVVMAAAVFSIASFRPHWPLFFLAFGSVIGNALFPMWLFQGLEKMEHAAIRDFVAKLLALIAVFALVHRDADYLWAAAAQGGGFLVAGIVTLVPLRWTMQVHFRRVSVAEIREQFVTGWAPFLSLALVAFGAATNMFILGLRSPGAEVAYFSAANRIIAVLRALVNPITTAVFPHAARKANISESEVIRFVRKYAILLIGPFLLGGVILLVGGPWFLPVLLGERYRPAVPVFQAMAFSPAVLATAQVYSTGFMLACGYYKTWMRIMLASVVVNFVVLGITLAWLPGSLAVGVTMVVAEVFSTFFYWRFFRRRARGMEGETVPVVP